MAAPASAAPPAPTVSPNKLVEGSTDPVTISGTCPVTSAPDTSKNTALLNISGAGYGDPVPLDAAGNYTFTEDLGALPADTYQVTVTCSDYEATSESAAAEFTVDPLIEASIDLVDNNGGKLLTGDPVSIVATQKFLASPENPYQFYVAWPPEELTFDESVPPKVQLRDVNGQFVDLDYSADFDPADNSFLVTVNSAIPVGATLTVEVPATVAAPAGATITVSSNLGGSEISKSYVVGESGAPTLVVTPTEGAAGINVKIDATGLQPNTTYDVEFHSKPTHVGQVTSDANGEVHTSITIPADAATGQHVIALFLNGEVVVSAPFEVTVTGVPTTTAPTAPTTAPTSTSSDVTVTWSTSWTSSSWTTTSSNLPLANTGANNVGPLAGAGTGLLVLGGALLLLSRRREADRKH
ncbi:LPXTG cell wall anchor domain-containing protein [Nakamurella aerolata]|uniref:LPXTG cell wall anchor domain-containing protein n=1 Tax=Nakamurella aerolata TaxID=1656892 RepID=A0A849AD72_9ACTN|nr:LPXTG cell wall anchor domain-containing protein [Nakamurella aerolata]NNG37151.1 LPXTG cell wall anchor domain-containing protein [Nakamurella aerolata]